MREVLITLHLLVLGAAIAYTIQYGFNLLMWVSVMAMLLTGLLCLQD